MVKIYVIINAFIQTYQLILYLPLISLCTCILYSMNNLFFWEVEPSGVSSYPLLCSPQLFILKCWAECNLTHSHSERPWNFLATFLALQWSPGSELFPSDASVIFIPVNIPWSQWKHSWGTKTLLSPCSLKVVTGHNFIPHCLLFSSTHKPIQ